MTECVAERLNPITCRAVGSYIDIHRIGVRHTVGHIASNTVVEGYRTCEVYSECGSLGTTNIYCALLHCGSSQRIDTHCVCGVVGAIVSSSCCGSYKGVGYSVGAGVVGEPRTRLRQHHCIASTDYRLVADYHSEVVGICNTHTVGVGD